MRTDDKVVATHTNVENNHNTRDQARVGIWWLVVVVLTFLGLMGLGAGHSPNVTQEPNDMSGTGANTPVDVNPPDFDVNRPQGVVEWPGLVGQKTNYLTGQGNSPVKPGTTQTGVSAGASPDTATDEASRKKAESGSTPSDTMPPPKTEGQAQTGAPASH